jgi:incFII family plasmid replication initiator RepA
VQLTRSCRQCFHYDPLANRVQRSITNMAIECGLATDPQWQSLYLAGDALYVELGLITYTTEYDPQIGCNIPTDMTFTPALFQALDVSDVAVVARRSRVEWENKQRKAEPATTGNGRADRKSWRFVRERFRSYQAERKSHGQASDSSPGCHASVRI